MTKEFWLKIFSALFSKQKIMAYIAAVIIAVIAIVFGVSPESIKQAVQEAPTIQLPVASQVTTSTVVPVGK